MGVRHEVVAERVYTTVDDLTSAYVAVFTTALVDEPSGEPVVTSVTLSSDMPGVAVRTADGGLIAGSAYADLVFPKLATQPYTFRVSVTASGYRDSTVTVTLPAGTSLPVAIAPLVMRRVPVRLQGRVVKASDRSAIGGATISGKDQKQLLLRTTLRSAHAAGVTVNAIAPTHNGPARKLTVAAARGDTRVFLDNNGALAPGAHLQLGSDLAPQIHEIASLGPAPGQVGLKAALSAGLAQNSPVQEVVTAGPSATSVLARSADVGDGTLIVNAPLTDTAVEVSDGAASEWHWLDVLSAPDGYYAASAVAGIRSIDLQCAAAGFSNADVTWFPEYSEPINVVDFRLKP